MVLDPVAAGRPLLWPPVVERLQALLPDAPVYIVGGAVRDAFLHRPLKDLDLAGPFDGRPLARQIADALRGAYYPLDPQRGVGRALITWQDEDITIDMARFRGADLLADLTLRDFTVNAMAVPLGGDLQHIIDPLGGLGDLQAKRLRMCAPEAIADDPVRSLRAIRLSITFGLLIEASTRQAVRAAAPHLARCSAERIRDEFLAILGTARPAAGLTALQQLGLLGQIVPEAETLVGVAQPPPHQYDVWRHTLAVVERLAAIMRMLSEPSAPEAANAQIGLIAFALARYRPQLAEHLTAQWAGQHAHRGLLALAGLLHDIGKPETLGSRVTRAPDSPTFPRHDQIGADIAERRAVALRLSNEEIVRLTAIVRHHMRPLWLYAGGPVSKRAVHRFWRDTGRAGIDVCLLAMADYLATYGLALDTRDWVHYLDHIRRLLEGYFDRYDTEVAPPALVSGRDLLRHLHLEPGPLVGELIEKITEAQVEGHITTKEEALDWARRLLDERDT
ncbi:MAG: HD domain-containing protein [Chloroflexota bacterium]